MTNTSNIFDCAFLWTAENLAGDDAYFVFEDEGSSPFARELIVAARGEAGLLASPATIAELAHSDAPVFIEAPVWHRRHAELQAAGVTGARARVLLYFSKDPTGYWDFAKACGPQLKSVLSTRRLDAAALGQLKDYLETWAGCRVVDGHILPMPSFTVRDYSKASATNAEGIHRILANLADDESRRAYSRIVFGSNEQILVGFVSRVFGAQQYMEIVKLKPGDTVVNCGVGRGWELPYFICMLQGQGRLYNFDPNIVWYSTEYNDFLTSFSGLMDEHPIILGDQDGFVDMPITDAQMVRSDAVGQDMAAAGVATKRYTIRKLDSLAAEGLLDRIDYLKMDVEGGELNILEGALASIVKYRPKLAIAIYHEPQHFWEYPLFLMDRLEGYRYYVRQYGYSRFETLLYAVPDEDIASRSGSEGFGAGPVAAPGTAGSAWLELSLRDRSPRDKYYSGGQRILNRFAGVDWASGRVTPAPLINTDEVIAVYCAKGKSTFVAVHAFAPDHRMIVVGESPSPAVLEWTASHRIEADTVAAPAVGTGGDTGFAVYDPVSGQVQIYFVDGPTIHHAGGLAADGPPVLVQRSDDGLCRLFWRATPSRLGVQDYAADGQRHGAARMLEFGAPFEAFAAIRPGGAADSPRLGAVTRARADRLEIFLLDNDDVSAAGELPADPDSAAVSTFLVEG